MLTLHLHQRSQISLQSLTLQIEIEFSEMKAMLTYCISYTLNPLLKATEGGMPSQRKCIQGETILLTHQAHGLM